MAKKPNNMNLVITVDSKRPEDALTKLSSHLDDLRKQREAMMQGGDMFNIENLKEYDKAIKKTEADIKLITGSLRDVGTMLNNLDKMSPAQLGAAIKRLGNDLRTMPANSPQVEKMKEDLEKMTHQYKLATGEALDLNKVFNNINSEPIARIERAISQAETELKKMTRGTQEYADKETELRRVRMQFSQIKGETVDLKKVLANIETASIDDLRKAAVQAEAKMNSLERGTKEFADSKDDVEKLRRKLDEMKISTGHVETGMDRLGKTVKRLFSYVVVYEGFNRMKEMFSDMARRNMEWSDSLTSIQKTTDLTTIQMGQLSDQLIRLNTRTPVDELAKLGYEAGKLGTKGVENVMGFVRAGNQIRVALGEDLGDDAITNLAKINEVLGVTARMGVEKALLSTGSAINELGQTSVANEGYMVDFTQRLGGIAAQTNMTVPQILALASVCDQSAQNVEVAATAMNKFIVTMVAKTDQVAQAVSLTGKQLKEAINKDTFSGLLMVFEAMNKMGGLEDIAPIMGDLGSDGARLTQVLAAMASEYSKLTPELGKANTAFNQAISITKEYDKVNNNLAANWEKLTKNMKNSFIGTRIIEGMNYYITAAEEATRPTQNLTEQFKSQVSTVVDLQRNIYPLVEEYETLQKKTNKSNEEQNRMKELASQIAGVIPSAATAFDEYGNAIGISTERVKAFVAAQRLMMQQKNKDLIDDETASLRRLREELGIVTSQRDEAAKTGGFSKMASSGGMNSVTYITQETSQEEIQRVQDRYIELIKTIKEKEGVISELKGDYLKKELDALKNQETEKDKIVKCPNCNNPMDKCTCNKDKGKGSIFGPVDLWEQQQKNALSRARINGEEWRGGEVKSTDAFNKAVAAIEEEAINKKLALAGLEKSEREKLMGDLLKIKTDMLDKEEKETEAYMKKIDKIYDDFEIKSTSKDQRELVRIQQKYVDAQKLLEDALKKQLITQQEYDTAMEKIKADKQTSEETYYSDNAHKEAGKEVRKLDELQAYDELAAKEAMARGAITEMEYKQRLLEIEQDYLDQKLAINGLTEEQITQLKTQNADRQIAILTTAARRQERIQQSYASVVIDSGKQVGDAFGKMLSGQEDAMAQFGESMVDVMFDVLGKMVDIWFMELTAKSVKETASGTMTAIGQKGLLGLLEGAAIAAAIQGALQLAKAGIKSAFGGKVKTKDGGGGAPKVRGYATGKYEDSVNVIGAQDGLSYNARMAQSLQTGTYQGPHVALFNEDPSRPELVVDGLTTQRLRYNYPKVYDGILSLAHGRLPQFADGNYPTSVSASVDLAPINAMLSENAVINRQLVQAIRQLQEKPLAAAVSLHSIEAAQEREQTVRSLGRRRRTP